jgi:hypothetical protein
VKKQLLVALASSAFACLGPRGAAAQLPGGIKVPKIPKREKAQPAPTPAQASAGAGVPAVLKHSLGALLLFAPAGRTPSGSPPTGPKTQAFSAGMCNSCPT